MIETQKNLDKWLNNAKPGEKIEYYLGPTPSQMTGFQKTPLGIAFSWARNMQLVGVVHLVQRRISKKPNGEGEFSYIAVKSK